MDTDKRNQRERCDVDVQGVLADIDRFASHDGPGIRTTVFLKGCPLTCLWCHSPETQDPEPELLYRRQPCTSCGLCLAACPERAITRAFGDSTVVVDRTLCTSCGRCAEVCHPGALAIAGRRTTVGQVVADVARDIPFYESSGGGVTVTGGEPARQPEFTRHLLIGCREKGIHTAVETSGYGRRQDVAAIAREADLVMFDLKSADDDMHRRYTGVSNELILSNLKHAASLRPDILLRVPCIAGVNDSEAQMTQTARVAVSFGLSRVELLPYNGAAGAKYEWLSRTYRLSGREPQTAECMGRLAEVCRQEGLVATISE